MKEHELRVNIFEGRSHATGLYIVIVDVDDRNAATCISFESGMDCVGMMARVAQAFETLQANREKAA